MLPTNVAQELKAGHKVEGRWFDQVTLLFADVVGYTTITAKLTPMEVCQLLDEMCKWGRVGTMYISECIIVVIQCNPLRT